MTVETKSKRSLVCMLRSFSYMEIVARSPVLLFSSLFCCFGLGSLVTEILFLNAPNWSATNLRFSILLQDIAAGARNRTTDFPISWWLIQPFHPWCLVVVITKGGFSRIFFYTTVGFLWEGRCRSLRLTISFSSQVVRYHCFVTRPLAFHPDTQGTL